MIREKKVIEIWVGLYTIVKTLSRLQAVLKKTKSIPGHFFVNSNIFPKIQLDCF